MPWKFISTMFFLVYILFLILLTSLAVVDLQDKAIWLIKSAVVVGAIGVGAYALRWTRGRAESSLEQDNVEGFDLFCFCGLPAKLRVSRTTKNPYRLFYNCPKNQHHDQCEFFRWSDETSASLERHLEEKNFLRDECMRLQQRIDYVQCRRRREKSNWDRVRTDLRSQLSVVKFELDDIKKTIQAVNESEEMPPIDGSFYVDDEHSSALTVRAIEEG